MRILVRSLEVVAVSVEVVAVSDRAGQRVEPLEALDLTVRQRAQRGGQERLGR